MNILMTLKASIRFYDEEDKKFLSRSKSEGINVERV